ncbi:ScbR family autoregulator-binding transcription factor [Streptomyces sp. NPDC012389]|uniref:ScbR family autoregulator-binding transcription factor n=1 Tax=Streptomyces sp. NPDC012389 TaxID=3364830 RepID=UPI0036EC4CC2
MKPPKQERAIRTRAAILHAAAEAFAESGFAGASVAAISRRAGLTLGALYFHFPNKEALAREIVHQQVDRVRPPLESEGLQRAIDVTLTWAVSVLEDPVLLAGARLVQDQEAFAGGRQNSHQQWAEVLTKDLRAAQERGELAPDAAVARWARVLVNACTGAQMQAQLATGRQDLPERVAEIWECVLPALARPDSIAALDLSESRGRMPQ